MFEVFSMSARAAVTNAHQEARSHGNHYIGTEHLLLGLLGAQHDTAVTTTLNVFNVTSDAIRSCVEDAIGPACDPQPGHLPFSPRAKEALQRARSQAHGPDSVQPAHVMAALMVDSHSTAAKTVTSLGLQPAAVRDHLLNTAPIADQSGGDN